MSTTSALLWVILALALALAIGALFSLALPAWTGAVATGAVFAGADLVFIYPRWKQGRG